MALTKIGKEGITGISNSSNANAITITSDENVGIGTDAAVNNANRKTLALQGAWGGQVDIMVGSVVHSQFGTDNFSTGLSARIQSKDGIVFKTNGANERMRIDSSGNVLVGTSNASPYSSTSGNGIALKNGGDLQIAVESGESLYVNRMGSDGRVVSIRKAGTFKGGIDVSSSGVTYNSTSDYRLKENVDYTWDATTRLKQLKPARFNFIIDETNTLVDGFIAHEVSSIVPEAISGTKDAMAVETRYTADDVETQGDTPSKNVGDPKTYSDTEIDPQGIDQSKLVPLLVKTIQELEARLTAGGL